MKRLIAALIALASCLTLVACGGVKHTPRHPGHGTNSRPHIAQSANGPDRCTNGDYATSCALRHLAPPTGLLTLTPASQGVDFAWTKVQPAQAGAFAASYLSSDPSKNWTSALAAAYHHARKGTVAVFETWANRALSGCAAGTADARFSEQLLAAMGYPRSHFDMAVDFDATQAQIQGPVLAYFRCANAAEPHLVGAYGDYYVIRYLASRHVITKSWQTYAWSGGLWQPASVAPLEQYLNGSTFDHDRALAADYGQFPTPRPRPVCIHRRETRSACSAAKTRIARDQRAAAASQRAYVARGCTLLSQRDRWFAGQLRRHPRVNTLRRRRALAATRRAEHHRGCGTFAHRVRWFTQHAGQLAAAN